MSFSAKRLRGLALGSIHQAGGSRAILMAGDGEKINCI